MIVKVLGSAAGGGFPQWNCSCDNCLRKREGRFAGPSRTQSQVMVSTNGENWHLLNASPDLRQQIEKTPELWPRPLYQQNAKVSARQSPICSVTLTNADLDHVLGLLLLREGHSFKINASEFVYRSVFDSNIFFHMLRQFEGQTQWNPLVVGEKHVLEPTHSLEPALSLIPIGMKSQIPLYVDKASHPLSQNAGRKPPFGVVFGLIIEGSNPASRFGYFPGVGEITPELLSLWKSCDLLFMDGTFWSEDELIRIKNGGRTATRMGHLPMDGSAGMMEVTKAVLPKYGKHFIHINNTNPVLDEEGNCHKQMRDLGWRLTFDGQSFEI